MSSWRIRARAHSRGPGSIAHPHFLLVALMAVGLTAVYLPLVRTTTSAYYRPAEVLGAYTQAAQKTTCATIAQPTEIDLFSSSKQLQLRMDDPVYYSVSGTTPAEIASNIQQCAKASESGEGYSAQTNYTLTWFYDTHRDGTACSLRNVRVGMHVGITLPKLQKTPAHSAALINTWDTYLQALTVHESGHATIDAQYAGLLVQRLNSLPALPCDQVSAQVHRVVTATETELAQANASYDTATDHGTTQGALFAVR